MLASAVRPTIGRLFCRLRRRHSRLAPTAALRLLQAVVAGVGDADYINRQLMDILAPKTDYMAVRAREG